MNDTNKKQKETSLSDALEEIEEFLNQAELKLMSVSNLTNALNSQAVEALTTAIQDGLLPEIKKLRQSVKELKKQ